MVKNTKELLIGDNPFHGISHLSQERSRARNEDPTNPEFAADLVCSSLDNGANGFMFSISEATLSVIRTLADRGRIANANIYAIVPYAYDYVRLASQRGGLPGLAKKLSWEIITSRNINTMGNGLRGILFGNLESLMKAYLSYEISRIRMAAGKRSVIKSILIHEAITDMALALESERLFRTFIRFLMDRDITPGFNTCNFPYLVEKLKTWNVDLSGVFIAAPFNKVGFQMCPSRMDCESALASLPEPVVIAISVLAAGYLRLPEAAEYVAGLPNIRGVAVGVSKRTHASQTFGLLRERLG